MKTMEVLLRENIYPLGKCGDVVRVKAGYARNYLLPERLATFATEDNKKAMARRRLRLDAEEAERMAEIETKVKVLETVELAASMRADENGRLYGSVNPSQVVELLAAQGRSVEPKDVHIDTPIKSVGTHEIRLHVHADRYAAISIEVTSEGGLPVATEETAAVSEDASAAPADE